jgi:uncharacterized protein (DUF433 family)
MSIAYPHIEIRENGKAYIAGTGFKVRMLVEEQATRGVDATELQRSHPHLSLGQIHAALTYYYDHKDEIDSEIAELEAVEREFLAKQGESLGAKKLRELGRKSP